MRRIYRRARPEPEKSFRANQRINAQAVTLIDEEGNARGITPIAEALRLAQEAELDLVEVNPKGEHPICKIMDFGQFKYEHDKKMQKQKVHVKKTDTKTIRLSVRIGDHDLLVRKNKALSFLSKNDKVKVEIRLKGRERQHPQVAVEIINKFVRSLQSTAEMNIVVEENLTKQENSFNILLANKK